MITGAGCGMALLGRAWQGEAGIATIFALVECMAWLGAARSGTARPARVWHGKVELEGDSG